MKRRNLFITAVLISVIFWFSESILGAYVFGEGDLYGRLFSPGGWELTVRLMAAALLLAFAWYAGRVERKPVESRYPGPLPEHIESTPEGCESVFRAAFDSTFQLAGIISPEGEVIEANRAVMDLLDFELEEIRGRLLWESTFWKHSPDLQVKMRQSVEKAARGEFVRFETELNDSKGGIHNIDFSLTPLSGQGGRTVMIICEGRDISRRARAERVLRESEERYRNIVENMQEGIAIVDAGFRLEYVNDELCRIAKMDKEELLGRDFRDLIDSEYVDLVTDNYRKRLKGENPPRRYEFNIVRPDGEKRRVMISASVISQDDMKFDIGIILDVTDRKQLEEKYRILFESSRDAILLLKPPDWRFTDANPATYDLFGLDRREGISIQYPWTLSPEYQPDGRKSSEKAREMIDTAMRRGANYFEWKHSRVDGTTFPATVYLVKVEMEGEEYLQATVRDVSKRKEAELERENLRIYLSDIINSMPSVLIGVGSDGEVTQWNREAEKAAGLKAEEAVGRPLGEVYPEIMEQLEKKGISLSSGSACKELRVKRNADGEVRYKDIVVYPISSSAGEGAVIREDDITEAVRLEEFMIQSEKVLSLGGLAAGMAHEINNPLAVIVQNASVISNRLSEGMPSNHKAAEEAGLEFEKIRDYAEKREILELAEGIVDFGKRAAGVIRDMLGFARKDNIEKTRCSVPGIIDESIEMLKKDITLGFEDIEVRKEYDPRLPLSYCQRGRIKQVFMNILRNCAEAMNSITDGDYEPVLKIRAYYDPESVFIEIEDNGPGIKESDIGRVFEPFFTTKEPGTGTGLGMSVSYFIITETHGGTLKVESEEGEWTRFILSLPMIRELD